MKSSVIQTVVAAASVASAHTIMQAVNGLEMGKGIYMPDNDNTPIQDVSTDSIACSGSPVKKWRSSPDVIEVQAGSQVTGLWLHELGSTGPDEYADNKVIASSHHGPVMAYLKKVDDATNNPGAGPGDGWFKISEVGYENKVWGVDKLIADEGIQTVTIPECIEDGDYLLRFELIALHSASAPMGAQFYLSCAQIRVTGGSASKKPETVSFPGAYSNTDPGILVQIWENDLPYPASYTVPGPAVFTC
ncbi:glycoside hydrolase [Chaetomium sp. MPI-CAGE-AT-0009]|nr:glycoside hydrolase [Chaetomium sp. MPI-CAGE-AT-0009]